METLTDFINWNPDEPTEEEKILAEFEREIRNALYANGFVCSKKDRDLGWGKPFKSSAHEFDDAVRENPRLWDDLGVAF